MWGIGCGVGARAANPKPRTLNPKPQTNVTIKYHEEHASACARGSLRAVPEDPARSRTACTRTAREGGYIPPYFVPFVCFAVLAIPSCADGATGPLRDVFG